MRLLKMIIKITFIVFRLKKSKILGHTQLHILKTALANMLFGLE